MSGATRERERVAALDGLRGLALVAVLAYHAVPGLAPGGFLGVDIFFVLSGFLLTTLLLGEREQTGAIDRLAYAVRRVRRIYPALLVLLAALVVIVPLAAPADAHRLPGDIVSSLLGLTNWHLIRDGSSYFALAGRPSFVRHLWSIAIEVQFYVLCPFLVGWLARRRPKLAAGSLVLGIAASAALMGVLYNAADPSRAYYGTDTRIHALLMGCLVAVLLPLKPFSGWIAGSRPAIQRKNVAGGLALLVCLVLFAVGGERARLMYPLGFLAVEMATAVMIGLCLVPGALATILVRRDMRWLGTRSYGIYLWHWPIVVLVRPGTTADWPTVPAAIAILGGGLLLGGLSYRYVERPFLRRSGAERNRAQHQPGRQRAMRLALLGIVVAVLGVALARIPTTNSLAEVLHAGEKVIAAQPPPTAPPETTTTATTTASPAAAGPVTAAARPLRIRTVPASSAPARAPAPKPTLSPPAPGSVPVTAIGDSVMVAAAGELQRRLGASGYIDAKQNRYFSQAAPIIHDLRARGALGRVVLIHLGNNGPVSNSDVDAVMNELNGVPNVLLVTVRVDRSWQDEVNQTLRSAAARYPAVQIVDWYSYSAGHGDWFQADGTHFRTSSGPGANAYADLLVGSIPPPPTTTTESTTTTAPPPPPSTSTTAAPLVP
ncbi:MAG TPA: acyltransferase family protein [Acidimicrobiales bacterium]|nr:acyltransferase family protein [Acidimicrobiales bacterium]